MNQKVTIGIPTYNRVLYLKEALESAINQTYKNIEIIVSDNSSNDGTINYLEEYKNKVKIINNPNNMGMQKNWNTCLSHASGQLFILLSDDDILKPDAIEMLARSFYDNNNILIAYSNVETIDKDGDIKLQNRMDAPKIETVKSFISRSLIGKTAAFPSATMFRTESIKQLGGYPDIGSSTDFGLLLKHLQLNGMVMYHDIPLVKYRVHSGAETYTTRAINSIVQLINWVNFQNYISSKLKRSILIRTQNNLFKFCIYYLKTNEIDSYRLSKSLLKNTNNKSIYLLILFIIDMRLMAEFIRFLRNLYKKYV